MSRINAILTTQGDPNPETGAASSMSMADVVAWLEADRETHMAVITSADGELVAVWCGASGERSNYYLQPLPLDEPDADGGDLTAQQAVIQALNGY